MIVQLSHYKREFKQIVCDTTNLEKVAREQQLEPRLLQSMKALSNGTPAAIRLKAAVLWKEFQEFGELACVMCSIMLQDADA